VQRRDEGGLADVRVRVEPAASAQAHPAYVANEHRCVDELELGEAGGGRIERLAAGPACGLER
jgi:hypothetical protein